ncbi:ribonuclease HII [Nigerium massiliense]|uniref:ribonuclease HII n=1 Tax=Nigerium massiliense TaxID=1522317 RepID=UPI000590FEDD|nr:ribonuclease HII [Nigerium massiliense]
MSFVIRRDAGLYGYERGLARAGFPHVAGADEAGRGACAGPLVAAAVVLPGRPIPGLNDSKKLTPATRERLYAVITERALAWSAVRIEPAECDRLGVHVANLEALRRAVSRLDVAPDFVLTDGFPVDGLAVPSLAMWKGDAVAASVSAASIVAKVTRDRIMAGYHLEYPEYRFDIHKGYCTALHQSVLDARGPCAVHRLKWENVARTIRLEQS